MSNILKYVYFDTNNSIQPKYHLDGYMTILLLGNWYCWFGLGYTDVMRNTYIHTSFNL